MEAIRFEGVSLDYGSTKALESVNFSAQKGDFIAIIGPNGGGKSSFLKLIMGLMEPQTGTIRVLGSTPAESARHIGYVPQDIHANKGFPITVLEVVLTGLLDRSRLFFRHSSQEIAKARETLAMVGMEAFASRRMDALSGGEKQRVFIARALISDPQIIVLDEPTSNIDSQGEQEIYEILHRLNERMTVLVVSHDIAFMLDYAKRIVFINKRITLHDAPEITKKKVIESLDIKDNHLCEVELLNYLSGVRHG